MARELRNTQIQLAFPGLELSVVPSRAHDGKGETTAEISVGKEPPRVPDETKSVRNGKQTDSRKVPRKRSVKPTMLLVAGAEGACATNAVAPTRDTESDTVQPEQKCLVGQEVTRTLLLSDKDNGQPVIFGEASPEEPSSPAVRPVLEPDTITPSPALQRSETPSSVEQSPHFVVNRSGGEVRLRIWAHLAAILASVAIVVALILGSHQFIETQNSQRALLSMQQNSLHQGQIVKAAELNSRAVELFLKYNELMLQVNAPVSKNAKKETRYWKENLAVNLLESLFNLTRGDKDWETTVGWALERHGRFLRDQRLPCAAYSNEFIQYMEKSFGAKAASLCK